MTAFKPGDRVRCVDGNPDYGLHAGDDGDEPCGLLYFVCGLDEGFFGHRFEPIVATPAQAHNPPAAKCAICRGRAPVDICASCQADCDAAYGEPPAEHVCTFDSLPGNRCTVCMARKDPLPTAAPAEPFRTPQPVPHRHTYWAPAWACECGRTLKQEEQAQGIARAVARMNERQWLLGWQQ